MPRPSQPSHPIGRDLIISFCINISAIPECQGQASQAVQWREADTALLRRPGEGGVHQTDAGRDWHTVHSGQPHIRGVARAQDEGSVPT